MSLGESQREAVDSLPANDIKNLSHGYGNVMRFPIVALLLGIVLIASGTWFGLIPLFHAITTHQNYGFNILKGFGLIALHVFIGYWLLNASYKKSNYILAETDRGPVKLKIEGMYDEESLKDFLSSVRNKLGIGVS